MDGATRERGVGSERHASSNSARGAIVLTYGPSDLMGLVDTLERAMIPRGQIVVVSQSDGISRLPVNMGRPGIIIDAPRNVGYGAGMNMGLKALPESVNSVLLLTPGVNFTAESLARAFALFEGSPRVGVLGPVLRSPAGSILSKGGRLTRSFRPYHAFEWVEPLTRFNATEWVDGAALLCKREVGKLPEEYFLYWEDVAYSLWARDHEWAVGIDSEWVAVTSPGAGTRRDLFRYLFWRNRLYCARRHGHVMASVGSVGALLGTMTVRPLQALSRGDVTKAIRAFVLLSAALRDGIRGRMGPPPSFVTKGSGVRNVEG